MAEKLHVFMPNEIIRTSPAFSNPACNCDKKKPCQWVMTITTAIWAMAITTARKPYMAHDNNDSQPKNTEEKRIGNTDAQCDAVYLVPCMSLVHAPSSNPGR